MRRLLFSSFAAGSAGQGTGGSSAEAGNGDATDGGANADAGDGSTGDPMLLSQTGLYANIATGALAPGLQAYQPQFALWSDLATKKRWIKLPPGSKIDTSDMNYWSFPNDTKIFKEFTRDGVRVETRMIWKHGAGDWFMLIDATDVGALPAAMLRFSGNIALKPLTISSGVYRLMWDLAKSDIGG